MTFPVYLGWGNWQIHPHLFFEAIAYFVAMRLLLRQVRHDAIEASQRISVIVGGLVGALVGAKLLLLLQHIDILWQNQQLLFVLLLQGKTVVGALLGGLVGVELTKKLVGVHQSTGDAFVYPLIAGTAIGRIGCFLTGLSDRTYGIPTSLPWGIDFGDGIARHPTQLYEILFLVILAGWLCWRDRTPQPAGDRFKAYLLSYLIFRWLIDFIKPNFHPWLGMSAIQVACLITLLIYRRSLMRLFRATSY